MCSIVYNIYYIQYIFKVLFLVQMWSVWYQLVFVFELVVESFIWTETTQKNLRLEEMDGHQKTVTWANLTKHSEKVLKGTWEPQLIDFIKKIIFFNSWKSSIFGSSKHINWSQWIGIYGQNYIEKRVHRVWYSFLLIVYVINLFQWTWL